MGETKNGDRSVSKPQLGWGLNIHTELVPLADQAIRCAAVVRDFFWKKGLGLFPGGPIVRANEVNDFLDRTNVGTRPNQDMQPRCRRN